MPEPGDKVGADQDGSVWPHAPVHRLTEAGTYFVTAATYQRAHHFAGPERLAHLSDTLQTGFAEAGWQLAAWAVFANHYHLVAHSPSDSGSAECLRTLLARLHHASAAWVNARDGLPGRRIWFNFWDTRLTYTRSYLARLKYVHHNPVKHGLVADAAGYPWCSARWFEQTATPSQVRTVNSFAIDDLRVTDDYAVSGEW